jgi:hypothetical protein
MSSNQPLWLRAVLRLERAVGEPVESAVRSNAYYTVVSVGSRATAKAKRTAEDVSRRYLHMLNLPAGSDVSRLREQLTRMERQLNDLVEEVAEMDGTPRRTGRR